MGRRLHRRQIRRLVLIHRRRYGNDNEVPFADAARIIRKFHSRLFDGVIAKFIGRVDALLV